ncbi:MAG: Ig-like domain-containing protein [Gemmatimonadaceae bacterium]
MHLSKLCRALVLTSVGIAACDDSDPIGPPLQDYEVVANAATISVGQYRTTTIGATVRNVSEDRTLDAGSTTLIFESTDSKIATVSKTGVVTGIKPGTVNVIIRFAGLASDTVVVTVTPNPITTGTLTGPATLQTLDSAKVSFTFKDASGTVIKRPVEFSVSDNSLATVNDTGLVVTGQDSGTVTVTATMDGFDATLDIVVELRPVDEVVVTPDPAGVVVGETVQLTATTFAANGEEVTGRTVAWSSSNVLVATVDQMGEVTGVLASPLPVTITAMVEGKSGSAQVLVSSAP